MTSEDAILKRSLAEVVDELLYHEQALARANERIRELEKWVCFFLYKIFLLNKKKRNDELMPGEYIGNRMFF